MTLQVQTHLKPHDNAQDQSEVWYGVSDAATRRKLQNRLNQRASRRRKAESGGQTGGLVIRQWKASSTPQKKHSQTPASGAQTSAAVRHATSDTEEDTDSPSTTPESTSSSVASCNTSVSQFSASETELQAIDVVQSHLQTQFERYQRRHEFGTSDEASAWSRSVTLPADNLLSLIYYNVYRALTFNVIILGLDERQMCDDVYPSPFLPLSPTASSALTRVPPRLKPTRLQSEVMHHAWLDIYPCSVMRDNVIKYGEDNYDDVQMCKDFVGISDTSDDFLVLDEGPRHGVTVWGDPWELESWEISESLAKKWPWLFKGAYELEAWTNFRRASRGWKTISFA